MSSHLAPQIEGQHHDLRANKPHTIGEIETPNEPITLQRKLSTDAAANYTGLARSTLEKLRVFGGGPNYLKIGRRVLYDVQDVERWLTGHRRRSTSGVPVQSIQPPSKPA